MKTKIFINTADISKHGGVANYFLTLKDKFNSEVYLNFVGGTTQGILFPFQQFYKYLLFMFLLIKIKPDLVHLNPSLNKKAVIRDAIYLYISNLFRIKVLVFWHGWDQAFEQRIDEKYKNIFRFFYSRADGFCVLANDFKKKLADWNLDRKPIFLEKTIVDDKLIENFSINNTNKNTILFLSRVEKEKGIYICIEAYKKLKEKYRNLRLVIAGKGSEEDQVSDYIVKNNIQDVNIVGYVADDSKIEVFKNSSIYILPTYHGEGMPVSILEAMMFGLPVITRPVGGIKDFFKNGKMGYITESLDSSDFANLIEKLIADTELLLKISSFNHDYAKSNFLASKVAVRIENIYRKILAE